MANESNRLESVQILRGFAAMAVVFEHSCWLVGRSADRLGESWLHGLGSFPELCSIGVDLFFVISGFVMALSAQRFVGVAMAGRFLLQRFLRIAPILYLITLAVYVQITRHGGDVPAHVLIDSVLIAPFFDAGSLPLIWPLVYFGWSLSYEFVFYLLVGIVIALRQSKRGWLLLGLLCVLPLSGLFDHTNLAVIRLATNWMIWEFALGVAAFLLWRNQYLQRYPKAVKISAMLALAVLALQSYFGYGDVNQPPLYESTDNLEGLRRVVLWGLPCFPLFCFALSFDFHQFKRAYPALLLLGNASYSIYLVQVLIFEPTIKIGFILGFNADLVILALLFIVPISGILCYRWFEKPVTRALQHWAREPFRRQSRRHDVAGVDRGAE